MRQKRQSSGMFRSARGDRLLVTGYRRGGAACRSRWYGVRARAAGRAARSAASGPPSSSPVTCQLQGQGVGNLLAVEVGVAPHQLGALLAAEEELDLVVLGEADAAVNLLTVRHHASPRCTGPWPCAR